MEMRVVIAELIGVDCGKVDYIPPATGQKIHNLARAQVGGRGEYEAVETTRMVVSLLRMGNVDRQNCRA